MSGYNKKSQSSIINYAKKLKDLTLRQACGNQILAHGYKGKGNYGQLLEKYYFGYEPNSVAEPDFEETGIELKSSPLKKLKNGEYRSKERLVLNIINYLEVHKEQFLTSTFWKKNAHLLLVFYLHDKEKNLLDYIIKLVDEWKYPIEDLEIIKQDWTLINKKIKDGKAHELSEGDTFYLGACTKGSTALKSYREQPFNSLQAKQRAYSLKQGYVNHIISNIAQEETAIYGKIIKQPSLLEKATSIESLVISKFQPYYKKTAKQIESELGLGLNDNSKSYFANLTKLILGIQLGQKIEEFEKAEIQVKTIRVEKNNKIKQSISFPAFKFEEIYDASWRTSNFKDVVEKKFLFLFFKKINNQFQFDKVLFWNMPFEDRNEARRVWLAAKKTIQNGNIFSHYALDEHGNIKTSIKGHPIRYNNLPKLKDSHVCHVRPHESDSSTTYPLPVEDKTLKIKEYTKQCFWLNANYVRDKIYLK